ncbi:Cdc25 phosphatase Ibp1 [Kickxella alabastrina]|uniref:Cdc25 phosphatase Ibp1 n=2 Tax=Kickxella alabastrina TaxID=61397 RepID=A0ACC1IP24_9FUNG|nr:Cdc25 phosphatase Ibp1 [Kickxella alabastrina]
MPQPKFIPADELAELIRSPQKVAGTDYLIVDVRDLDYVGGHITGAINVPAHLIRGQAPVLADQYKHVPRIVFHCALSQVRGPKSARIYSECVEEKLESAEVGDQLFEQEINILRGGFDSWLVRFKDTEPELIEAYDATVPRDMV